MPELKSNHLTTLSLTVDYAGMLNIGTSGIGRRRVAPVTGGRFEGERLSGMVLPGGADWVVNRQDGVMVVDVRLTLKTDADGALIYLTYQGALRTSAEAMERFNKGGLLSDDEFNLRTIARFETGSKAYLWLNDMIAVGVGKQTATGPIYEIFEVL
jgi:hypothetical protein